MAAALVAFAGCASAGVAACSSEQASEQATAKSGAPAPEVDGSAVITSEASTNAHEWHQAMHAALPDRVGCFHAVQPSMEWQEIPCAEHPSTQPQASGAEMARRLNEREHHGKVGPEDIEVGNGTDFTAVDTPDGGPGALIQARGSFPSVSGVTSVTTATVNPSDGTTTNVAAGAYSLQLNARYMDASASAINPATGRSVCFGNDAGDPTCTTWAQFTYGNDGTGSSTASDILIEYWVHTDSNDPSCNNNPQACGCPAGWGYQGSCFVNMGQVNFPAVPITNLHNMVLIGSAGPQVDKMSVQIAPGNVYATTSANVVNLYLDWDRAEFNVFGINGLRTAVFNPGSKILVQTLVQSSNPLAAGPSCLGFGQTGETSTLWLEQSSCVPFSGTSRGIQFFESNPLGASTPGAWVGGNPNTVSIPSGSQGTLWVSVQGQLVGHPGTPTLPSGCKVGPLPGGIEADDPVLGEQLYVNVPAGTATGPVTESFTCNSGESGSFTVQVTSPVFYATPSTVNVAQGQCAFFNVYENPSASTDSLAFALSAPPSGSGLTISGAPSATFQVCASATAPVTTTPYALTVSSGPAYSANLSNSADYNTALVNVNVTPCQPEPTSQTCVMTGSYPRCGYTAAGCGVQNFCGSCPTGSGLSCSNTVCCPQGYSGSDGTCCPTGQTYVSGSGCMGPCAAGTAPCPIAGAGCYTARQCQNANNGGNTPGCALTHTCN